MVGCYKDTTYCASPNCENDCGRQFTDEIKEAAIKAEMPVMFGYFCGDICEHESDGITYVPEIKPVSILSQPLNAFTQPEPSRLKCKLCGIFYI